MTSSVVHRDIPDTQAPEVPARAQQRRQTLAATALLVVLAAVMTWPQVIQLATHAQDHYDVYFNMWRFAWVAHALTTDPLNLFNGNIFHPEERTLTLSDAMLFEGIVAAPMHWAGLKPVLIHNVMLLGGIVSSAAGMFVLARHLTRSAPAAMIAAIVFAFAPYRFDHYMHMELQWTTWIPWTFWAMHRTIETRQPRYGLMTGVFLSLQMLSSIYYGLFLAMALAISASLLMLANRAHGVALARAFAPGALAAAVVCGAYAQPYLATKEEVGIRHAHEVGLFSARPVNYLGVTPDNVTWGETLARRGRPERRLFPGAVTFILAMVALLSRVPSAVTIVYLVIAAAAFEISLGLYGYTFRFLYEHVPVFQGLRAIARAGVFVLFAVGVLAAIGFRAIAGEIGPNARRVLAVAACALLLLEFRVRPLGLVRYPNAAPPVHAWLAGQPAGVVVELPMAVPDALPGLEAYYSYISTFHWKPTVNGYSGFYPESFLARADALRAFPDDRSIAQLRRDGVRYLVVHLGQYNERERDAILESLNGRYGFAVLGRFPDDLRGEAIVWSLR